MSTSAPLTAAWPAELVALPPEELDSVLDELSDEDLRALASEVGLSRRVSFREHLEEVDPGPHLDWWHVGAMIEAGQAVLDGEILFLMLHMSRRYYKSRTMAQGLPSCFIRNNLEQYAALLFASDELAREHSAHARDMVQRYGLVLRQDTKNKAHWRIAGHHGGMWITTTHGFKVGRGWRLGVVDDPMTSFEAAQSAAEQRIAEDAIHSFRGSAEKGLPRPALVLMHQRLGVHDPAGRFYEREKDEAKALGWTVVDFPAERRPRRVAYPETCMVWPDPRELGEPLCPDLEGIEEIRKRQAEDPLRAAAMDAQEPMEGIGGGLLRASWLPIIGAGRSDLGTPVAALVNMSQEGMIQPLKGAHRGHDFAAGGADAVASCGLYRLVPGAGPDVILFDPTEDYPPAAGVESVVLRNAGRTDTSVRQAIPQEPAVGKVVTASVQRQLQALGYGVDVRPVGRGKLALARPLAAHAAPSCRKCAHIVVAPSERGESPDGSVCQCEDPDVVPGKVAILAGPGAERLRQVLHDFTGEDGVKDDLTDAAAIAFNASGTGDNVYW